MFRVQSLSRQGGVAQLSIRRILLHHTKHISTNNYATLKCTYYMNRQGRRKKKEPLGYRPRDE
jgi:hypothetical protein